jgi:quercetin dioxygenase-like cupin family protein
MRYTLLAVAILLPAAAAAQQPTAASAQTPPAVGVRQIDRQILVHPARLEWKPAPAALPPGAQVAVLEGDPTKPGLFTMRIRMPGGYRIRPHFHEADEHVTVISGTFVLGMGETWSEGAGSALSAGGYAAMPAGMRHFAITRGRTVVQVHAVGPWKLTYANPADDPRNASK